MNGTEAGLDLCVIGASEAGLAACMGAVALGLSCALVDDGDASGLRNPDLALATLAHQAADPTRHDGCWTAVRVALAQAAPDRRHARFGAMNVRLLRGTGRFVGPGALQVGPNTIRARRFFIATGGEQPARLIAEGLADGMCLSVADLGSLEHTPPSVIVIGGGPDAVSAAQSLSRLGSQVTLISETLLTNFDPELSAPLLAQLRRDGIAIRHAKLARIETHEDGVRAGLTDAESVTASHLLLADEARPALDRLDLAQAGVARHQDGSLTLDDSLRTSTRAIFAIGRAAGARSTAEGLAQAGHVLRAAFVPIPSRLRPELVPVVLSTDPEIAMVGRQPTRGRFRTWRYPLAQTGGAAALGITEGHAKIMTDARGRILWAGLVGSSARELIPLWALAIGRGLTLADLAEVMPPTPSLSESLRALAVQDLGRRIASPLARRILRAARWLG